jgi:ABC-type multidrug transport system ATPase subunit
LTGQITSSNNVDGVLLPPTYIFKYDSGVDMVDALASGTIGQGERNSAKFVEFAIQVEQRPTASSFPPPSPPIAITIFVSDVSNSLREMFAAVQSAETLARSPLDAESSQHLLSIPTYQQLPKGTTAVVNAAEWGSGGVMILAALPIAFMSAFYGERLVRDRAGGMRVHLFVSSLRRTQYYAGNFLVDFAFYLPVAVLTPILLVCFQFPGVLQTNLWAFFWMFLFFGPVVIGFGYLLSWLFSSVQTAQEWFGEIINFSMAIPFLITSFVILDATELGHSVCGLIPGYAVYRGMGVIEGEAKGGQPYLTWGDIFSPDRSLLWVLVIMMIDIVLYWSLIMVVEMLEARCGACRDAMVLRRSGRGAEDVLGGGGSNDEARMIREADPRVLEEISLVKRMTGGATVDMSDGERKVGLVLDHMSKTFVMSDGRLNRAVRDVCLTVDKGTVFGLLGMNGAGKTTLLHAIQGKHQATGGDCYVDSGGAAPLSCRSDVDRVRQLFGICPQHEVLWEYVTPREHLRAFAHIRGVHSDQIEDMVETLLKRLDLLSKAEEPSGKLSGGMKRRLSIAMSVIGSPKCVFLDEPTTGLDPNTRRFVWDYILEIKKGRIIILTTHSMEEADALCTNIGACFFFLFLFLVVVVVVLSHSLTRLSLSSLSFLSSLSQASWSTEISFPLELRSSSSPCMALVIASLFV